MVGDGHRVGRPQALRMPPLGHLQRFVERKPAGFFEFLFVEGGRIAARGTFDEVRSQVVDFDRQAQLLGL